MAKLRACAKRNAGNLAVPALKNCYEKRELRSAALAPAAIDQATEHRSAEHEQGKRARNRRRAWARIATGVTRLSTLAVWS